MTLHRGMTMQRGVFEVEIEMRDGNSGAAWIAWSKRTVVAQDAGAAIGFALKQERRSFSGKQFPVRASGVKRLAVLDGA